MAHYAKTAGPAFAAGDRARLASIEDGPMLTRSLARYKDAASLPAKDRSALTPPPLNATAARLYIPRLPAARPFQSNGTPHWFAAAFPLDKGPAGASRLAVFAETPNKQWKAVSLTLLTQPLPAITLDSSGLATAVNPNGTDLAATTTQLRDATTDNYATGGTIGGRTFTPTPASQRQITTSRAVAKSYAGNARTAFRGTDTTFAAYALKTAQGALVLYTHEHVQEVTVTKPGMGIVPSARDRAWLGKAPQPYLSYTFQCHDAALVPYGSGPSRLLDYTCARTDVTGTRTTV
ncbi:hypothetical protein ACFYVL_09315 [Streptomyces sp. NPDC004111]|uniref:hypothetical protein n=1 Tax=Streptomyces sp. NPDC004111 TaxID=3364690 RepID=UPI0036CE0BB5